MNCHMACSMTLFIKEKEERISACNIHAEHFNGLRETKGRESKCFFFYTYIQFTLQTLTETTQIQEDPLPADSISSIKWSVLAHLKSQPRQQNFQAQNLWSVLAHIILKPTKIPRTHLK